MEQELGIPCPSVMWCVMFCFVFSFKNTNNKGPEAPQVFEFSTLKPLSLSLSFWKFWSPWQHRHPSALPSWSCHKRWTICWSYHSNMPCLTFQWASCAFRCSHDWRNYTKRPCAASKYCLQRMKWLRLLSFSPTPLPAFKIGISSIFLLSHTSRLVTFNSWSRRLSSSMIQSPAKLSINTDLAVGCGC